MQWGTDLGDRLGDAVWWVNRALPVSVPRPVARAFLRWRHEDDFDGYDHPPDPFATPSVDPVRIEGFTGRPYPPYHGRFWQLGTVRDGDWDRTGPDRIHPDYRDRYELYRDGRFSETTFYRSLEAHFVDGAPWEETLFVRRCLSLADRSRQSWHSLTSREEILERCAHVDDLYERIRTEGYRSQRDLGNDGPGHAAEEVCVDVARDGRLLFVNGRHRLAIAKLLGVDRIPVGVLVRHSGWMTHRERIGRASSVDDVPPDSRPHLSHPDVQDVHPDRRASR